MTFIGGSFGFGPAAQGRSGITRGRIQGGLMQGVNYPSPFFDIGHTYLPTTIKSMFRWCRYYFLTNPVINAVAFKLSEYPVTELIIEHPDTEVREKWMEFFQETIRFRPFQIESGLDFNVYGNSFSSVGFPFKKYLKCPQCTFNERADKIRHMWTVTNFGFRLTCPKCGNTGTAEATDVPFKNAAGINMIRWNAENLEINYNEVTGDAAYFYQIPPTVRNDALIGKKDAVENMPQVFLQAMREQKGVVFAKSNFFHLKRPSLAQQDRGWGIPLILPVMKDTFYLQLMKKAQEAILLEHIVPLRVLFPQAGSGSSDPYTTINLETWRDQVAGEIARWRLDNNYIPILPLPIGNQTIGGDGRALLLTQEIQTWTDQIIQGMGTPLEFIRGGMSYAGTNVSMRMLENSFINYILRQKQMANWVVRLVSAFMGWPKVGVRFKPFKMADDIQRKAFLFQMNQAGKVSDTTLLADSDLDHEQETRLMLKERPMSNEASKQQQLSMAKVQGDAQVIMAKAQAKAQQTLMEASQAPAAPGEPGDGAGPNPLMPGMESPLAANQNMADPQAQQGAGPGQQTGISIEAMAEMLAQQVASLPPDQQQYALQNLQAENPELAQLVQEYLRSMQPQRPTTQGGALGQSVSSVNMQPLPEQRAPRRMATLV